MILKSGNRFSEICSAETQDRDPIGLDHGLAVALTRQSKQGGWTAPWLARSPEIALSSERQWPESSALRLASNRNQTRRSASSIKFSRMLAVATSPYLSQASWHSRISAMT